MNHSRRLCALAAACTGLFVLTGCHQLAWDDTAGSTAVEIVNRTDNTVRASLHLAERREGRDGANLVRRGDLETIWRKNAETIEVPKPSSFLNSTTDYVIWLRIEPVTPSWRERPVHWFEFLGPPPRRVVVSEKTRRDETSIIALADEVLAEPVPFQYWPVEDMTFADNGP